ncbi:MAG TPA: NADH:ubiquinone reductase (Na(+)-transporting) subunit D [Spirochaetes bacterium]|nr:NADH:ubiquinone reductase (Na(+)-transporting) subunit D [Spirochaetota bacterium]
MSPSKFKSSEGYKTIVNGLWRDHPVFSMVLGICSALAVSNRVDNAIAMTASVTFVLVATAIIISLLRGMIPMRVRIITFMIVIATFVIIVDRFLKAFFPSISTAIGPYVGLIITNCIIMGRAEAFYIQNNVRLSILDALANGAGYGYTLISIAIIRELLGFGSLLGIRIMPEGWTNWVVMSMAPGAFFLVGIFIWFTRTLAKQES